MRFVVHGTPIAKARARLGKQGSFYTPRTTRVYEERIAWAVRERGIFGLDGPLSLRAEFHMPTARRIDGDNLLKSLLDGCEKGELFPDDKLVTDFQVRVFYSSDNPRTEWEVEPLIDQPHTIYCHGARSAVFYESGEWRCSNCNEQVSSWFVPNLKRVSSDE